MTVNTGDLDRDASAEEVRTRHAAALLATMTATSPELMRSALDDVLFDPRYDGLLPAIRECARAWAEFLDEV